MGKFQNYPQEIRDKKKEFVMVFSSYRKFSIKYFYIFIPLELKYRNMFGSKLLSSLSSTYWKMLFSKTLPYFLCKNLKKCQRCFRIQIKPIKWLKNVCPELIPKKNIFVHNFSDLGSRTNGFSKPFCWVLLGKTFPMVPTLWKNLSILKVVNFLQGRDMENIYCVKTGDQLTLV